MRHTAFRSKVDWWLAALLLGSAGISVAAVAAAGVAASPFLALAVAPLLLVGAVLTLWLLRATDYTFDDSNLHVRCGPFRWLVPLREIRSVTPTRDPASSPALSLDRLRIDFGRTGSIMISPADKEAFLAELETRMTAASHTIAADGSTSRHADG